MRIASILVSLILVFSFSCISEESLVYASSAEAYYHLSPVCRFGNFGAAIQENSSEVSLVAAVYNYQRACPACASEWKVVFSGSFPEWTHETAPWDFGSLDTYLPYEITKNYGEANEALYALEALPDDFGGIFRNASGTFTLLIKNPTIEKVQYFKSLLNADFFVMEATYDKNTLLRLQSDISTLFGDENGYGIHTSCLFDDANRIVITTNNLSSENILAIEDALYQMGWTDKGMYCIEYGQNSMMFF
ncbi:MAG: hypothetical protein IJC48_11295 [Clostridia bacterium]|nr:hypothetical protein [Clostridia bacterium]MBQ4157523.1 hypothetical protein [Clostridia bacterium]